jgi:hypothetical protein
MTPTEDFRRGWGCPMRVHTPSVGLTKTLDARLDGKRESTSSFSSKFTYHVDLLMSGLGTLSPVVVE